MLNKILIPSIATSIAKHKQCSIKLSKFSDGFLSIYSKRFDLFSFKDFGSKTDFIHLTFSVGPRLLAQMATRFQPKYCYK